jgi:hypothetical protein
VFLHHLDGDVVYVTLTFSQDDEPNANSDCAPGEIEGKVNKPSEFSDAATRYSHVAISRAQISQHKKPFLENLG